jgi:hypothetical protein
MAGTIKLDGATFLEKDGGNYKISNTELKLKSSGNTIVDSSGNALVSESSGKVTLQGVTLGDTAVPNTPMMFRNKIINGNFDIWQRGTSQTSSGYGSADRWQNYHDTSTKTASQQSFTLGQTEVPGNPKYYLRHVITTGGGANDRVFTNQRIEDVSILAGKTFTFSFWAKADSAKNIAIEVVQNFGTGGSPTSAITGIGVTTYSLTTSWQKFTGTISIPSISGKTIGTDGNDYTSFSFWFDAGSTYNSRTNSLGNQSGTFDIAQVQLEEGSAATPFEQRPIGVELSLCQRYYSKSAEYDVAPAEGSDQKSVTTLIDMAGGLIRTPYLLFPVHMRTMPTITFLKEGGTGGGTNGQWGWYQSGAWAYAGFYASGISDRGFSAHQSGINAAGDGYAYYMHINWTADAEL